MTRFHAHRLPLLPLDMAHRDHDYDVGGVALAVLVLAVALAFLIGRVSA